MNLVIVESPAKAGTIQKFLGADYTVKSSFGHIRDLHEKSLSIDTANGFKPEYTVPADKKKVVAELKKLADKADVVWLASDEDREGEAISWHLSETLGLDPARTRRIVFHEITRNAILKAIENPRQVDINLVNAQQARRVLDRLVGFELSPILWRKVQRGLSAGRVQSVALRLVVDREKEIMAFVPECYYRIDAEFDAGGAGVSGQLDTRFQSMEKAEEFLRDSIGASYRVASVEQKDGQRVPAAPFTTSTLQQEAGRKFHFPVSLTMRVAQSLYEKGLITYMRTDSTNLSTLALGDAKRFILDNFGPEYLHTRQYKTSSKGAQEAHEAIRPTYIANPAISGTEQERKLYELIWKRTIASQMSEAKVVNTSVKIASSARPELFSAQASRIVFDGFLKIYMESDDDAEPGVEPAVLPALKKGDSISVRSVSAVCKYTQPPYRYSEPTLVKKLEELGIGRPSTYAPTIDTLTRGRGYILKGDKAGRKVAVTNLQLRNGAISSSVKEEIIGAEKGKLLPAEIGMIVTDYLVGSFSEILDYDFTANVEREFDLIAEGKREWSSVISRFYSPFHDKVETTLSDGKYSKVSRMLGTDPSDGKPLVAKFGQFGPYVQKGEGEDRVIAGLSEGQLIETLTLEEAVRLFRLPRTVGEYNGTAVTALKGRFGPYLKYGDLNISLSKGTDPVKVTLEECISVIESALAKSKGSEVIKEFPDCDIKILEGRYGAYIKCDGANYRLPKGCTPEDLTEEQCREIIGNGKATAPSRHRKFTKRSR